ncbi:unnamed protein product [Caenorhabditis bovis]|uniref:Uncharacterized protein n=1 Tax=Caenorhabditis bovis TaxID=2654633 RepID=A0A8S1FCN0_9PELO|nr:unnamed protein product [Caenorhabditis bovis]
MKLPAILLFLVVSSLCSNTEDPEFDFDIDAFFGYDASQNTTTTEPTTPKQIITTTEGQNMNSIERLEQFGENFSYEEWAWFSINCILLEYAGIQSRSNESELDEVEEACRTALYRTVVAMEPAVLFDPNEVEWNLNTFFMLETEIRDMNEDEQNHKRAEILIETMKKFRESREDDEGFESEEEMDEDEFQDGEMVRWESDDEEDE